MKSQLARSSALRFQRTRARIASVFFSAVITMTDLLPPRLRYGYVHRLTRLLFRSRLPKLDAAIAPTPSPVGQSSGIVEESAHGTERVVCALVAGALDIGGIGSVIEVLTQGLPTVGIRPVVICLRDGMRAARIRDRGVEVVVVRSEADAVRAIVSLAPNVIQLHAAPEPLENAAIASGIPLVPVLHNTEIHFSDARWQRFSTLLARSAAAIAVSELVRAFHAEHLPNSLRDRITVVPNAVPTHGVATVAQGEAARVAVERIVGAPLADAVVFASLARYDAQKNIAGLVASFLSSVRDPRARLVIAGEPSDWAELRLADAIRRCSPRADRVHLLAGSDARTLLAASDGFILNSFFEGWPVAATEAAAMGLPLILSDVGGARELVARDPDRSIVVPNPCGRADGVSDGSVARARRSFRHQSNAVALGAAVDAVVGRAAAGSSVVPLPAPDLMQIMMEGHAMVLRAAAQGDGRPQSETGGLE